MKGPGSGVSKKDLLLLAVAAACSMALLPAPRGHVEIQIQGAEVKCSSCCIVVPCTDAGAEPRISYTAQANAAAAGPLLMRWMPYPNIYSLEWDLRPERVEKAAVLI